MGLVNTGSPGSGLIHQKFREQGPMHSGKPRAVSILEDIRCVHVAVCLAPGFFFLSSFIMY